MLAKKGSAPKVKAIGERRSGCTAAPFSFLNATRALLGIVFGQRHLYVVTVEVISYSPDITSRDSRHTRKLVATRPGVEAGHNAPLRAIPVLDPITHSPTTHSPDIVG